MNENGHDRAAALIEPCFDNSTLCGTVRVCLELLNLCKNYKVFKKIIYALAGLCRDRADYGIAAPFLWNYIVLCQLLLYTLGVCTDGIHLVDGNDERDAGSLCVVDALNCLRHYSVVGRNYEDRDIGYHSASGSH